MIMTYEWAEITDFADELSQMILQSEQADLYREAYDSVYNDKNLANEIHAFARLKEQYEEVQRFGKYHPEYSRVMKQIRVDKRRLDLNEKVANLRLMENELQDLMDQVSFIIGRSVSEAVKIPSSNPFFSSDSSCGSSCGTGGGCSCSA
ncbi:MULTISPECIES: YlbF family regulator [Planococcus]|uniref:Regulator n=2 Tax=Planococcus TaxID=1372 RepID=A0ABM5WV43_9BACL|nr:MULTISPECIES: YlbF family regulator [Planococcus]ALS78180.1 regulator [Planococcus kocurii]AQU79918.1 regulator [Planococcus faecalis]KAA0958429.1 YlbF family regulator [Planococcus sp. ANT_H30]MDJ0330718.1 YlbF family regulator [Planococcus sp. S3-L1]OHX53431.1 regulator [Planococcus faecalis]